MPGAVPLQYMASLALLLLVARISSAAAGQVTGKPLKVFIMAGQSNMEGHGFVDEKDSVTGRFKNGTLSFLIDDPRTKEEFASVLGADGKWIVRNDVIVTTTDQSNRTGSLTVGLGGEDTSIGPELGFGIDLANKLGERILLLKTVWGGKSLAGDFRPPSAVASRGNPQNVTLVKLQGGKQSGVYFKLILDSVRDVLGRLPDIVPSYDSAAGYELAAFEWHQGWNDACDFKHSLSDSKNAAHEYEKNLADFVVDMREAIDEFHPSAKLPFVVGASGFAGKPGHEAANCDADFGAGVCNGLRMIWSGQMAVGDGSTHPEVGVVTSVDSVPFLREKQFSPGGQGYHWWNNAETYYLLGKAMAHATFPLLTTGARSTGFTSCCAGTFVSEGRGGVYPPGSEGKSFNFLASNDNASRRFAQRSADPAVEMGTIILPNNAAGHGGGHWAWTNATNCVKLPNPQTTPNLCFGEGFFFGTYRGSVVMAGVTLERWSPAETSPHIVYTTQPSASGVCDIVLEQGYGAFTIAGVLVGTLDDGAAYYNYQRGKKPDESAFQLPEFCPQNLVV